MRKVHSLYPVTKTVTNISFNKDKLIITKYNNREGEIDQVIPYSALFAYFEVSPGVCNLARSLLFPASIYDDDIAKKERVVSICVTQP